MDKTVLKTLQKNRSLDFDSPISDFSNFEILGFLCSKIFEICARCCTFFKVFRSQRTNCDTIDAADLPKYTLN